MAFRGLRVQGLGLAVIIQNIVTILIIVVIMALLVGNHNISQDIVYYSVLY